ncbi:tetratricopeptide repeat protein [Desulfogranum japonicum]|uniref:tetratricopeptide repeat protein n=1 Tax=Desulfogranum japonicum TaxID=231447 RepID=UPI000421ECD7|nr:hypothetical protein [Desulfogranum japonicum]
MAKKRKKNVRSKRSDSLQGLSTPELLNRGKQFFEQSKFREAINCCKQVIKNDDLEDSAELFLLLEQSYIGRIDELSEKEMLKEAFVILENMVRFFPEKSGDIIRLNLLVRSGEYAQAVALFSDCQDRLSVEQIQRMHVLQGALLLTNELSLEQIDADCAVARDYPLAQEAVCLFTAEKHSALQQILGKISFRSPFKDLRLLLAGVSQLAVDAEKGQSLLRKIARDSPYFGFATSYLGLEMSSREIIASVRPLPRDARQEFFLQRNVDLKTCQALASLLDSDDDPEQLYRFVKKNKHLFSREKYTLLEKNLLIYCGESGARKLEACKYPLAEKYRLLALTVEQDGAGFYAQDFWEEYLAIREKAGGFPAKEKAMIYRHMAATIPPEVDHFEPQRKYSLLKLSLEYDPSHAETWLAVARSAKQRNSVKAYYDHLNEAVHNLPDNVDILLASMKAAAERKAFKKASRIAQQVLAIDPINIKALDFVVESHLEHARKLVKQTKWQLAEKELHAAGTRVKSLRFRGRNRIGLGMVRLLQKDDQGLEDIRLGKEENGSMLLGALLTSLEARLYQLPSSVQNRFDRELKKVAADLNPPKKRECLRIISWLSSFPENQQSSLHEICGQLGRYFSRIIDLEWNADEGLSLCRTLESLGLDTALGKCARRLEKRFPGRLEFKVWRLVGDFIKSKRPPGLEGNLQLEDLFDILVETGQHEFIDHIIDVLQERSIDYYNMDIGIERENLAGFDMEDFLEEVFKPRKPVPEKKPRQNAKPKSGQKQESTSGLPPLTGRQLNLFGDEI